MPVVKKTQPLVAIPDHDEILFDPYDVRSRGWYPARCTDAQRAGWKADQEAEESEFYCPQVGEQERNLLQSQIYFFSAMRQAMRHRRSKHRFGETSSHLHSSLDAVRLMRSAHRDKTALEDADSAMLTAMADTLMRVHCEAARSVTGSLS